MTTKIIKTKDDCLDVGRLIDYVAVRDPHLECDYECYMEHHQIHDDKNPAYAITSTGIGHGDKNKKTRWWKTGWSVCMPGLRVIPRDHVSFQVRWLIWQDEHGIHMRLLRELPHGNKVQFGDPRLYTFRPGMKYKDWIQAFEELADLHNPPQ